jgi:hypothetical protein
MNPTLNLDNAVIDAPIQECAACFACMATPAVPDIEWALFLLAW